MKTMNTFSLSWAHQINKHLRLILFEMLALAMFCGISVAQPHHRADLGDIKIIDIHVHPLRTRGIPMTDDSIKKELKRRITAMDNSGVTRTTLLCHGFETTQSPNRIQEVSEKEAFYYLKAYPERFVVFTAVDFSQMNSPDFSEKAVAHIESTVRLGARGLKFELGKPLMHWMPLDDPRLDPVYDKAAELGLPIMFHCNDPDDFFYPINNFNFWLGVNKSDPGYYGRMDKFVSQEQVLRELENMLHKHPNTTFIFAHMGFLTQKLALLADIFDRYPNVYGDLSCSLDDFGRSPKESAAFITYYSKRIMFGTDALYPQGVFMDKHFAILESDQDDLPTCRAKSWNVHGLNLSKEVLEQIYYKNAEELLARPVHIPPVR
jgi:predicted TIM-barrel fold metal-dependent hydrolase